MPFKFRRSTPPSEQTSVYAPAKRKLPRWQWYLLALVIMSPLLYILGKWILTLFVVVAPGYVTTDVITVRTPADAYVEQLNIHLNDHVTPNQVLLTLKAPALAAQIAALQENINHLQLLQSERKGLSSAKLAAMEQTAQIHVKETAHYYQQFQQYYKEGLITVIDLSAAEDRYHAAKMELQQIQEQIQKNNEDYSIVTQQNYDQLIAQQQVQLASLQAIQNGLILRAAAEGTIVSLSTEPLEFVSQGSSLLEISTNGNWQVKAFFDGKDIADIHPGQKVKVLLPNFEMLSGHIINQPNSTASESQALVFLKDPEQKLVGYVLLDEPLPAKYQVNGMGVKVLIF